MVFQKDLTQKRFDADKVLDGYYQLLGYPYIRNIGIRVIQIAHPENLNEVQFKVVRALSEEPSYGLPTLGVLEQEAFDLEPGWENLSPEKRQDVAIGGSELFFQAFGHTTLNVSQDSIRLAVRQYAEKALV